jgi:hypothetical protein
MQTVKCKDCYYGKVPAESMTLADAINVFEETDAFTFAVKHDGRDPVTVELLDESGLSSNPDSFFVAGFEFGPHVLIHARSFESAWEAWVDDMPTIPECELIEAYGIVDDYRDEYVAAHPIPSGAGDAFHAWHAFYVACNVRLRELGDKAQAGGNDYPELIEGYEMQSNCSGTGIVSMGHYAWMNEIDPSEIVIVRKAKVST